jgi:small-conductance mechanosensitive channel
MSDSVQIAQFLITATASTNWVTVGITLVLTVVVAFLVERLFRRKSARLTEATLHGDISPQMGTRLQFLHRFTIALIIAVGLAFAALQLAGIKTLAQAFLTTSAVMAVVAGFAARQTLGNLVAGIMLVIAQPLRVGDWVTFETYYGVVEELSLTYTRLRTPGEGNIMIPNDKLAGGILMNDTLGTKLTALSIDLWLPHNINLDLVIKALHKETSSQVRVAEVASTGTRVTVAGEPCEPPLRDEAASELRVRCMRVLRNEGLLTA